MRYYKSEAFIAKSECLSINKHIALGLIKPHKHDFIELTYILQGEGMHAINDSNYSIKPGAFFHINSSDVHSMNLTEETHYYDILIDPSYFFKGISPNKIDFSDVLSYVVSGRESDSPEHVPKAIHFSPKRSAEIEQLLKSISREYEKKDNFYLLKIKHYLHLFLIEVIDQLKQINDNVLATSEEMLKVIKDYVDENFTSNITMTEVALKYHYNPSYFSRLFKVQYGVTFSDYLHKKRVEKAVELLKDTSLTIEQIGVKIGYTSGLRLSNIWSIF